ncbi:serine hydrolase [Lutibacter sp.]|uniref:serine hydrolase n=1 Tax=Lutibacter sp. TaxID=1925666 RepID=UPI001A2E922B|nr:serine hydrolase [Lutibacter sp.]
MSKHLFLTTTSQEIASVSKQFTATAILLLQQENKLKVSDLATNYLGDYFPEFIFVIFKVDNFNSE